MSGPVIHARSVGRRLSGRWAVSGVDLEVASGERVLVHGPNGSGKTTLLRLLSSALSPSAGSVALFGVPAPEARGRVALLSHADGHYDDLTGRDNLVLAARLGRLQGTVSAALESVGLFARADDLVRNYSAGMRKRLAFARLLLKSPALVLLDEPYAALDPAGHAFVDELLTGLAARGATVVVSTHQVDRVAPGCTQAVHMEAGRRIQAAAPQPVSGGPLPVGGAE